MEVEFPCTDVDLVARGGHNLQLGIWFLRLREFGVICKVFSKTLDFRPRDSKVILRLLIHVEKNSSFKQVNNYYRNFLNFLNNLKKKTYPVLESNPRHLI